MWYKVRNTDRYGLNSCLRSRASFQIPMCQELKSDQREFNASKDRTETRYSQFADTFPAQGCWLEATTRDETVVNTTSCHTRALSLNVSSRRIGYMRRGARRKMSLSFIDLCVNRSSRDKLCLEHAIWVHWTVTAYSAANKILKSGTEGLFISVLIGRYPAKDSSNRP